MKKPLIILPIVLLWMAFFIHPSILVPLARAGTQDGIYLPPIEVDPETAEFIRSGDWKNAIVGLRYAWEQHGSDPNLSLYLAEGYKRLGFEAYRDNRLDDALELFDDALEVRDQDSEIHLARGMCFFKMSEYSDARQSFEEALYHDPNNFPAHLKLGEVLYLINEPERAALSWENALKLKPEYQALKKRLAVLYDQIDRSQHFEVEADRYFSVVFDGEKIPQLRYKVLDILWDVHHEVGQTLWIYPKRQIAVTLLTHSDFQAITDSPSWVSGLYEGQIKIPVAGYDETRLKENLFHEYVHAVIFDMMSQRCPWWLNEGLAQYFSPSLPDKIHKKKIARKFLEQNPPPSLMSLRLSFNYDPSQAREAYALAFSAVNFFIEEFNFFNLQNLLVLLSEGISLENALHEVTGYTMEQFQQLWYHATTR